MVTLTKMNNSLITVNEDLIESIEETPDTVITFTTGKKLIVKENIQEIVSMIKVFKKEIYSNIEKNFS
jgi:flagellar protein FlbD